MKRTKTMPLIEVLDTNWELIFSEPHLLCLLGTTGAGKSHAMRYLMSRFTQLGGRLLSVFCKDKNQLVQWCRPGLMHPLFVHLHSVSGLKKFLDDRDELVASMHAEHNDRENKKLRLDPTYHVQEFKFSLRQMVVLVIDDPGSQPALMKSDVGKRLINDVRHLGLIRALLYQDYTQIPSDYRNAFNFIIRFKRENEPREKVFYKQFVNYKSFKFYECITKTLLQEQDNDMIVGSEQSQNKAADRAEVGQNALVIKGSCGALARNGQIPRLTCARIPPKFPDILHPSVRSWARKHYISIRRQKKLETDPEVFSNSRIDNIYLTGPSNPSVISLERLPFPIRKAKGTRRTFKSKDKNQSDIRVALKLPSYT
jgi:hypothetical protein